MSNQMDTGAGILMLLASGFVCYIISMQNPGLSQAELGAMFNVVGPFLSTAAVLVIYGLTLSLKEYRNRIVIILAIVNILVGVYLYNIG